MDFYERPAVRYGWEDPKGARGEELRATWARLSIRVETSVVTQVIDGRTRALRDAVYGPLYSLAEVDRHELVESAA